MATDPGLLTQALVSIARRAASVDLRALEEKGAREELARLVEQVRSLLAAAEETLHLVLSHYEAGAPRQDDPPEEPEEPSFFITVDRLTRQEGGAQQVADLCFVARMELRSKMESLTAVSDARDRWKVLTACDRCLRSVRKAAAAIEGSIARREGLEPQLHFRTELFLGRRIRSYYARFRREIHGDGPPSPPQIRGRLQSAAASIAKLIGRDFYGDLRVNDRAGLLELQQRLLAWLRGSDGYDARSGRRLWQDLDGFAFLLREINQRSELVEADGQIVAQGLEALSGSDPSPGLLSDDLLQRLELLRGRSDGIDRLLASPVEREAKAWREPLLRLQAELAGSEKAPAEEKP